MKTIQKAAITLIFSIFYLLISFVNGYAQDTGQWEILNEYESFSTIDFVNAEIGWGLSLSNNTLFKTEDGGESWFSISEKGSRFIDFINENVGWSSGGRILFKTEDGGETWITKKTSESGFGPICVVNESTIYVVDEGSKVLKTIDGGLNWIVYYLGVSDDGFRELVVINPSVLLIWESMRGIFRSVDGSYPWQNLPKHNYDFLGGLQFINDSTGYITARKYISNSHEYFLLETRDTCSTWSVIMQSEKKISSFKYLDPDTVYATIGGTLMKSIDGGISWEALFDLDGWRLNMIYCSREKLYIRANTNGAWLWLSTFDDFNTWRTKISYPFHDVFFINKNKGFAAGGGYGFHQSPWGNLWLTEDGGITWSMNTNTLGGIIKSCIFVNDSEGFILGGGGFQKTTDGGNNWETVTSPDGYSWSINDICFINTKIGWLSGIYSDSLSSGAAIFSTSNYGENWDLVWKYPDTDMNSYSLYSIHAINTTVWAVGESGLIVKYTEQDQWQLQTGYTDLPLNDVFFSDEDHGWITGGYLNDQDFQSILLKTRDGGSNWQEIPDINYQINDMFFADSLHGWAVGNDTSDYGMIIETYDGGENWTTQVDDLSAPLTAIHFKDGFGWSVGGKGLVLRYDGLTWVDQSTGKTYPDKFNLSQNYPNPFNPSTKIKFALPKPENVKIDVYNTLGQKIETLLNQQMKAGHHEVEFNAQNLSSGLYYYRIEAGEFQDVKKMILLK